MLILVTNFILTIVSLQSIANDSYGDFGDLSDEQQIELRNQEDANKRADAVRGGVNWSQQPSVNARTGRQKVPQPTKGQPVANGEDCRQVYVRDGVREYNHWYGKDSLPDCTELIKWSEVEETPNQDCVGPVLNEKCPGYQAPSSEAKGVVDRATDGSKKSADKSSPKKSLTAGQECEQAITEMNNKCEGEGDRGLIGARKMVETMTNGLTAVSSQDLSTYCSKLGTASVSLNGALGAYKGNCYISVDNCERLCSNSRLFPKVDDPTNDKIGECKKGRDTIRGIESNMTVLASQLFRAKQCENYAKQNANICANNPFGPGCQASAYDCRNPMNAQNPTCMCQSNPSNPICAQLYGKLGSQGTGSAALAQTNPAGAGGTGDGSLGLSSAFGDAEDNIKMPQGDGAAGKAPGGGGGRQVSANTRDGKGPDNNQGGGAAQSSLSGAKVNQGFYGGGGGGGFGGSGYSGSRDNNAGAGQQASAGQPRIDLKQFLPGGALDPRRRPAGVVGPDGITGPSLSLFAKINNRYSAVGHTLLGY